MTKKCPSCLSLLGDNTRNKIIQCLRKKSATVSEIAANFSLKQPTISHHLKILKELGMVKSQKTGREVCYCLNNKYPCKKCNIFKLPFKRAKRKRKSKRRNFSLSYDKKNLPPTTFKG